MADRRGFLATLTAAALALGVPAVGARAHQVRPEGSTDTRPEGREEAQPGRASIDAVELNRQFARLRGRAARAQSMGARGGELR